MPQRVYTSEIDDVRVGTTLASAMMDGSSALWIRSISYSSYIAGRSGYFTVPAWANFASAVLLGGGGGGEVGNGGNGTDGKGGSAGQFSGVIGMTVTNDSRVEYTVGQGGSGGTGSSSHRDGTASSVTANGYTYTAVGGTGGSLSGSNGGANSYLPSSSRQPWLGTTTYSTGSGGRGGSNVSSGQPGGNGGNYGAGGGGGRGGFFSSYTNGGDGAGGYVRVTFWGQNPTMLV